jgi:hypothetical protein
VWKRKSRRPDEIEEVLGEPKGRERGERESTKRIKKIIRSGEEVLLIKPWRDETQAKWYGASIKVGW